jgi:hypothetical protein
VVAAQVVVIDDSAKMPPMIQPSEFIIRKGKVVSATYSTGPIGPLIFGAFRE